MSNLPEIAVYDTAIYQIEKEDAILAGAGAIANYQATQLGNRTAYLKGNVDALNSNVSTLQSDATQQNKAMSGDLVLAVSPVTLGSSAAVLNAAAAGTITHIITINIEDAGGVLHYWSSNTLAAAVSSAIADADVLAPLIDNASPALVAGTVDVVITYDTDAGVTKTYAVGDTVTVTVSANVLGYTVADVTFIDTIVA